MGRYGVGVSFYWCCGFNSIPYQSNCSASNKDTFCIVPQVIMVRRCPRLWPCTAHQLLLTFLKFIIHAQLWHNLSYAHQPNKPTSAIIYE